MADADIDGIVSQIIAQCTSAGGDTWTRMKKSGPLYIRGYAQALEDIAAGVVKEEISPQDAEMYVKNAQLILVMSIANTSQIVFYEVQKLIDGVLALLKGAINARLPFPVL